MSGSLARSKSARSNSLQIVVRLAFLAAMVGTMAGCRDKKSSTAHLDFNRNVQPILASNCFSCHGPDPGNREAGLRLDLEESAFRKRTGHPDAIVPGHPELSELIKRIESHDAHHLMPQSPQGEAKPMKPEEIALLKEWVKEGAVYRPHWAFDPTVKTTPPALAQAHTPIDGFIQARLAKDGLHPSPEADRPTVRRSDGEACGEEVWTQACGRFDSLARDQSRAGRAPFLGWFLAASLLHRRHQP